MRPTKSRAIVLGVFKWMLFTCSSASWIDGLSQTLSAGHNHNLALKKNGAVVAWGANGRGQCDVPSGLKAVAVSAGRLYSLALTEDGTVVAWGDNLYGQCEVPIDLKAIAVCAGNSYSLALKEDGTVVAWGWNNKGTCDVPSNLKAIAVSAGWNHCLALEEDGTLVSWGSNARGQGRVPNGLKAVAVSAGEYHSLALQADGTVVAWGDNSFEECDVPRNLKAVAVSAGSAYSLALKEDGTVVAWGRCDWELCNVPRGLKAVAVDARDIQSLALKENGTVVSWGRSRAFKDSRVPSGLKASTNISHREGHIQRIRTTGPPPSLRVETATIGLQGSSTLGALSNSAVLFDLTNTGGGVGYDLVVKATLAGDVSGIEVAWEQSLTPLKVGETRQVSVPITTNRKTVDGMVRLEVEVIEPRGFSTAPFAMEILTKRFKEPDIQISDFACSLSEWISNTPIELDVLVQNMGRGDASDIRVELELPNGVACFSNNEVATFESLAKGEVQKISYDLMVPRNFQASFIKATISLTEHYGEYGSSWHQTFPFTRQEEQTVVVVAGERESQSEAVPKATLGNASGQGGEIIFNQTNASHPIKAVAVIPKNGVDCNGATKEADDLAVYAEASMLGMYTVVDRKFFEETLNEIRLSMTGLTFENGVLEAGCIENAQGYVFVEYGCIQNQETIKAKLIHCESSEIVWTCLGQGSTPKEMFEEISNSIVKEKL